MSINYKKGINLTSGFKYVGGQPLDVRLIAEDESDLQSLVDNGATYNGMVVWVNSTSKRKVFNGSEFIEDVNPNTIGNINDVLEQINGGGTFSGGGSSSGGSSGSSGIYEPSNEFLQFLFSLEAGNDYDVSNTIVEEINNIPINTIAISTNTSSIGVNLVVPFYVTTIGIGNDWNEFSILGKLNLKNFWTNFTAIFMYDEPTNRYHCVCTQ